MGSTLQNSHLNQEYVEYASKSRNDGELEAVHKLLLKTMLVVIMQVIKSDVLVADLEKFQKLEIWK